MKRKISSGGTPYYLPDSVIEKGDMVKIIEDRYWAGLIGIVTKISQDRSMVWVEIEGWGEELFGIDSVQLWSGDEL